MSACAAWGQAPTPGDLALVAHWAAPVPAAAIELVWINHGNTALAIWPLTDTDSGPQHDALRWEHAGGSAALIAPRKHAAPRWCRLAPGQRLAVTIDLGAWQRRLMAPGSVHAGGRMAYEVAPGQGHPSLPLPDCAAGPAAPTACAAATAWTGRLTATLHPPTAAIK